MIQPSIRPQRIQGDKLPNELLLQIYPHLSLRSLIAARGVDRRWRSLVSQAYILPSRKRLLELYLSCVESPAFLETRSDILPHVDPFDRDAYMRLLPSDPPAEFELWIREWPANGVIGWIWPALSDVGFNRVWNFQCRCNCLGHSPPYVKDVTFHERIKPSTSYSGGIISASASDSKDVIYHAAAYLPAGTDIILGGGISWLDEDESATVSIELTVLCVCTCTNDGSRFWLVLGGKRGGEKMKGTVYLGSSGMDLKEEHIVAKSWPDFLQRELDEAQFRGHAAVLCNSSPVDAVLHSPKLKFG